MGLSSARHEIGVLFLSALLLFATNCSRIKNFVESSDPYHTATYKDVCNEWSREARIHRGLEVELIVSATYKSKAFRLAYAGEHAAAYRLREDEKRKLLEDQLDAAARNHEFLMAAFVPEKKWDEFDKADSMWKLYLVNDNNDRVLPIEVRKVEGQQAVTSHFFSYVTPWKSVYAVRFPYRIPGSGEPIIGEHTKQIKFVVTSVLGTGEMAWNLEN